MALMEPASGQGRVLAGRYRLHEPVGRGGMGSVWRAEDTLLGRTVAVKEVLAPADMLADERARLFQRTMREARAAARIGHPAAVTIHDVVEEDGRPWIVMEFLRARSLEQILRQQGPVPPPRAARIGAQVLAALRAGHAAGVLHRDVKPANVMVGDDDRVTLTDFGIAAMEDDAGTLTHTGTLLGSPAYLAPERARGEPATPACDLWSLGATLFAAVQGHGPYDRGNTMASIGAILTQPPPPATAAGPLRPAIEGLLNPDPHHRLTADHAARMLGGTPPGPGMDAHGGTLPGAGTGPGGTLLDVGQPRGGPHASAPGRRRWWIAGIAAAVVILAAAGGGAWYLTRPHLKPAPGIPADLAGSQSGTPDIPHGYHRYKHSSGFSAAVPNDFHVNTRRRGSVSFDGDTSTNADGCTLIFRQQRKKIANPMTKLRSDHKTENANVTVHEIPHGHGSGHYVGARAASWTYNYDDSSGAHHEYDLEFNADRFYTIEFRCPTNEWKGQHKALRNILATFRPVSPNY